MVHSTNLRVVYREKCYCAFQEKTAQRRIDEVSLETDGSTKEHIHLELNSKFHISRNTNNVVLGNHAVTVIPSDTDLVETSLEDILECVTGGYVKNCGPLNALCQEANCYQLWT